jgi:hypothetical protein
MDWNSTLSVLNMNPAKWYYLSKGTKFPEQGPMTETIREQSIAAMIQTRWISF